MPLIDLPVLRTGIFVDVDIWLSAPRRELLFRRGLPVPPAVRLSLIVDTGAGTTMINDRILTGSLGLQATNQTQVETATTVGVPAICDVYDVELLIAPHVTSPWKVQPIEVIGKHLPNIDGMLGRDVLNLGILEYNGPARTVRLTYPR